MKLLFLPHAGGSAKSYCSFKRFFPNELSVVPMELSGHFTRSSEPLFTDIPSCVSDLIDKHYDTLSCGDYAVFGHSLGTLLASELVRQAKERGLPLPYHVFLSGRCAPNCNVQCFKNSLNASDSEIISFFKSSVSQTPPIIQDEELIRKLNTLLCNDVRMADKFSLSPDIFKFDCDITVLYANDDIMLKNTNMNDWISFTSKSCSIIQLSGGHFFFNQHKKEIADIILKKIF